MDPKAVTPSDELARGSAPLRVAYVYRRFSRSGSIASPYACNG